MNQKYMQEGDKKFIKGVQILKEDEKAKAKDEGGKEVYEEIKLHKSPLLSSN